MAKTEIEEIEEIGIDDKLSINGVEYKSIPEAMVRLARAHDHIALSKLLKIYPDLIDNEYDGVTPLLAACKSQDQITIATSSQAIAYIKCINLLLAKGASPEIVDVDGKTAFMHFVSSYNSSLERDLTMSPIRTKEVSFSRFAVSKITGGIDARDKAGNTALMLACKNNCYKLISKLIRAGANVNAVNNAGETAFLLALTHANRQAIGAFLSAKELDLDFELSPGQTVLKQAKKSNSFRALDNLQYFYKKKYSTNKTFAVNHDAFLLDKKIYESPVHAFTDCAGKLDIKSMKHLIRLFPDIINEKHKGQTALIAAVKYKLPRELGDVVGNVQDSNYGYVIPTEKDSDRSKYKRYMKSIEFLLANNASPGLTDADGNNALMIFVQKYMYAQTYSPFYMQLHLKLLLSIQGIVLGCGITSIPLAIYFFCADYKLFNKDLSLAPLQFDADIGDLINMQNAAGDTALALACKSDNHRLIEKFIKAGGEPNIANNNGKTPLMFSVQHPKKDTMKSLLATKKVDIDRRDSAGCTAIDIARAHKNISVKRNVNYLRKYNPR